MLAEGVRPVLARAGGHAGRLPGGPLQITDELNMELMEKIAKATKEAAERDGATYAAPGHARSSTR